MTVAEQHSLYRRDILRLAMALPHQDALDAPHYSANMRAALCGSEMTAEAILNADNSIQQTAFRAKACALGQASAAVLRGKAIGLHAAEIAAVRDQLKSALHHGSGDLDWDELEPFRYASAFPARHAAILLPFDTLLAALNQAAD
jgi:NifU-like protein involved in Fe-S cluster formation